METRIEYGILWTGVEGDDEVELCESREDAEHIIRMYRSWEGKLFTRKITIGEWEDA